MHVIVLGAGVVGMTTAYYLSARGCTVTLVDEADEPGMGASFANGGQLSYSFTDSLAKPAFLRKIPGLLLGRDPGSRARLSPRLMSWGLRFLAQCTSRRAAENTLAVLAIAMRSAALMEDARKALPFDFSFRPAGKLVLLGNDEELEAARETTALKQASGCDARLMSHADILAIEPVLAHFARPVKGAVYSASDEVGDALLFCRGLRAFLDKSQQVDFQFGHRVVQLAARAGTPTVICDNREFSADAVIVCLGVASKPVLGTIGLRIPVYPVRGYSVTLPLGPEAPSVSVSSLSDRIVFSRLNGQMRIAGFADFNGCNTSDDKQRVRTLLEVAAQAAPGAADYSASDAHGWGGFRPMTPDGVPLVGRTRIPGIFLNTGHGMLGWTLACATAQDTVDAVLANH